MNIHKLDKAEELWREYERHSKEYEKEQELEEEEIEFLTNLNYNNNGNEKHLSETQWVPINRR